MEGLLILRLNTYEIQFYKYLSQGERGVLQFYQRAEMNLLSFKGLFQYRASAEFTTVAVAWQERRAAVYNISLNSDALFTTAGHLLRSEIIEILSTVLALPHNMITDVRIIMTLGSSEALSHRLEDIIRSYFICSIRSMKFLDSCQLGSAANGAIFVEMELISTNIYHYTGGVSNMETNRTVDIGYLDMLLKFLQLTAPEFFDEATRESLLNHGTILDEVMDAFNFRNEILHDFIRSYCKSILTNAGIIDPLVPIKIWTCHPQIFESLTEPRVEVIDVDVYFRFLEQVIDRKKYSWPKRILHMSSVL